MNTFILFIDNDTDCIHAFAAYAQGQGFTVVGLKSTLDAEAYLRQKNGRADVIILNRDLPYMDPNVQISRIMDLSNVPLLLIGSKADNTARIIGYEVGADDLVEKPLDNHEFLARIKARLRRHNILPRDVADMLERHPETYSGDMVGLEPETHYLFDGWCLMPERMVLTNPDGKEVELTGSEQELLQILVRATGRVLTRQKLFELLMHSDYDSYDRSIDTRISRLRKKLNDTSEITNMIRTVHGMGYMFTADVREVAATQTVAG